MVLIAPVVDQAHKQRSLANNRKKKYRDGRSQLEISSSLKKRLLSLKKPSEDWNAVVERLLVSNEGDDQGNSSKSESLLLEGEEKDDILILDDEIDDYILDDDTDDDKSNDTQPSQIKAAILQLSCISNLVTLVSKHSFSCGGQVITNYNTLTHTTAAEFSLRCLKCSWEGYWSSQNKIHGHFIWDELRVVSSFTVGKSPDLIDHLLSSWKIGHPESGSHETDFIKTELVPVIQSVHNERMEKIFTEVRDQCNKDGSGLSLGVDGTFQNRNNNSNWGSAVIQDLSSHYILNITTINIDDTPNHTAQGIEVPASISGLKDLYNAGFKIDELTTDGKADIETAVKQQPNLKHIKFQRDGWHKAKNLEESFKKHILAATKCERKDKKPEKEKKMNLRKELAVCGPSLVWHWKQSRNCNKSVEIMKQKFATYLNHKKGDHSKCWAYKGDIPVCHSPDYNHPPLSAEAFSVLKTFMEDKSLLDEFHYYTSNIETSSIESFNNTRASYLDKRENWEYYPVRILCAWMDWNENCKREVKSVYTTKVRAWKRNHKYRTDRTIKHKKTYTFRDEIVARVFPDVQW